MTTLEEGLAAMAEALEPLTLEIPGLQIHPYFNVNPSPPSIDIYPGDPFQEGAGMGVAEKKVFWTVRARVSAADPQSASQLLLRLLDVNDAASVEAALLADDTAYVGNDGGVSGFTRFADDQTGDLLGVQWRVEMFL
jgi:hypothetical protein